MASEALDVRKHDFCWYEWILYTLQMVLAVFVATVLIANICGTPITTCLISAGIGTIIYAAIAKFRSPMFISSCGATVSAVTGALAGSTMGNYIYVAIGGLVILLVYVAFALIVRFGGKSAFDRIFPPTVVGSITMVIGLNLAGFLKTYVTGSASTIETLPMIVALCTMLVTAVSSHYMKGFLKSIAFLIGLCFGYLLALTLELSGAYDFGIVAKFSAMRWFRLDDFTFMRWDFGSLTWRGVLDSVILFLPVSICAAMEHYSDHKTLSNIIGSDLTADPGLSRTLIGDGVASAVGSMIGGLPNTSYSFATLCGNAY
jgi:uracil permease